MQILRARHFRRAYDNCDRLSLPSAKIVFRSFVFDCHPLNVMFFLFGKYEAVMYGDVF